MFIKIAEFYRRVRYIDGNFIVEFPEGLNHRATSLQELFDGIKSKYPGVVIPDAPYTRDLSIAESLVRAGFKYCGERRVKIEVGHALLRPQIESIPAMEHLSEVDKAAVRLYELVWADADGKEDGCTLTEAEIDSSGMVDPLEYPVTG